jgi:hypothetical protein
LEERCGLVYARVSEAGERSGEGTAAEHLELSLVLVDKAAEAVGNRIPVVAAGSVTVQVPVGGTPTLLGQRHAMGVWMWV